MIIPSDEESRNKLTKAIEELVSSMYRQDGEKDLQKNIISDLLETVDIDKKVVKEFAAWQYANITGEEKISQIQDMQAAYEILYKIKDIDSDHTD